MWNKRKVSIVIPALNEEESIKKVVKDFSKPFVDEIIVVNSDSTDKTAYLAKIAGAKVVNEQRKGY